MIKVFKNIYKAETFGEKVNKKCCNVYLPYIIKCEGCNEITCFYHAVMIKKGSQNELICEDCY